MENLKIDELSLKKQIERIASVFDCNSVFTYELHNAVRDSGMTASQVERQFSYVIQNWDRSANYGKPQICDLVFSNVHVGDIPANKVSFVLRSMIEIRMPNWQEEIKPISNEMAKTYGIPRSTETKVFTRTGIEEFSELIPVMYNHLLPILFTKVIEDGKVKYNKDGFALFNLTEIGMDYSDEVAHFLGLSKDKKIKSVYYFDLEKLQDWNNNRNFGVFNNLENILTHACLIK